MPLFRRYAFAESFLSTASLGHLDDIPDEFCRCAERFGRCGSSLDTLNTDKATCEGLINGVGNPPDILVETSLKESRHSSTSF